MPHAILARNTSVQKITRVKLNPRFGGMNFENTATPRLQHRCPRPS